MRGYKYQDSPLYDWWLGWFTDDFGDRQDILFAPDSVFQQWQYFVDPATQIHEWSQANA